MTRKLRNKSLEKTDLWWNRKPSDSGYWKTVTLILLGICGAFLLYFSVYSGPNGDDMFQNYYADHVLDFYASMGKDTAVLHHPQGHLKYYGGFYEIPSALMNKALGYSKYDRGYHVTRHLLNSLFGFLAIISMVFLSRQILDWRAAAITALLFLCTPVFMFHGAINPKDIPFAAGVGLSIWAMWNWFKSWPEPSWRMTTFVGLAIGSALAVRIGGVLLFGYLGLFTLILLIKYRKKYKISKTLPRILLHGIVVFLISFFICIVFWPYALLNPVKHIVESFLLFNEFDVAIKVLFQGNNVLSDEVSMAYTPVWMYKTLPLICLIGLALCFAFANSLRRQIGTFTYTLLVFTIVFPLGYMMFTGANVYDSWRHSLFVFPSIACLAGLSIDTVWRKYLPKGRMAHIMTIIIIGILSLHPLIHMVKYPHYAYIFFNLLNNSPSQVNGEFETDYWGLSMEKAIDWMEKEGILAEASEDSPLEIATHSYYGLQVAIRSRGYGEELVKTKYTRYQERFEKAWDYGIYPARFVPAEELRSGVYPSSYAIKTFSVDGSPVCTIMKSDPNSNYQKGNKAMENGEVEKAVGFYEEELKAHPDNIPAIIKLSNHYLLNQDFVNLQRVNTLHKTVSPESTTPILFDGLLYLNTGNAEQALKSFDQVLKKEPNSVDALFYTAMIYNSLNRQREAIALLEEVIDIERRYRNAYVLLSEIYRGMGDEQNARIYERIASQLR